MLESGYFPDVATVQAVAGGFGHAEVDVRDDGGDVTLWLSVGADLVSIFSSLGILELDNVWHVRIGMLISGEGPGENDQYHRYHGFWGKDAYTRWASLVEYGPAISAFDGPGGLRERNAENDVMSWIVDMGCTDDGGEPHR